MIESSASPLRLDCETSRRFLNQSLNLEPYTQQEISFEDGCHFVGQSFLKDLITDADRRRPSQQTYTHISVLSERLHHNTGSRIETPPFCEIKASGFLFNLLVLGLIPDLVWF